MTRLIQLQVGKDMEAKEYDYGLFQVLRPGDIIHLQVGMSSWQIGDGYPPWIPTDAQIEDIQADFEKFVPEGVTVWATHFGVEASILRLRPGDIFHAKVGVYDMGDGQPPWRPKEEDLRSIREDLKRVLPEGVDALVTSVVIDTEVEDGN